MNYILSFKIIMNIFLKPVFFIEIRAIVLDFLFHAAEHCREKRNKKRAPEKL